MTVSELSVRRPVLVTMVFVLICTVAFIFVPRLNIALYPKVSYPYLMVSVDCNDAGPEEIELQVAKILENMLGSIEGLESITTTSGSGYCRAGLEFSYSTDLDDAYTAVNSKLSSITRSLPSWCEVPTLFRFDQSSNSSEIMTLTISGPYSQEDLKSIAEDKVVNLVQRIEGVAQVSVNGRDNTKYKVIVNPTSLEGVNLTLSQVSAALKSKNVHGTGGNLDDGVLEYTVTLDQRFRSLDEIRDTVITKVNGIDIKVSDVAEVKTVSEDTYNGSYINGEPVVMLRVSNESDSNASRVAKLVRDSLPSINDQLPNGVSLAVQRDQTEMISSTMSEVYSSAIEGVLLAAVIIFLFLRAFRTTFIIALSMPISILITLMVMSICKITVNSMSMSGLILGIGMIVDASICILEKSYSLREQGYMPAVAAILGSKRMLTAIFASTATTICVFLPILIYRTDLDMIGMMFLDLILTICVSLAASLFVAVTLVPALFGSILRVDSRIQKPFKNKIMIFIDNVMKKIESSFENLYVRLLKWCLNNKMLFVLLIIVIFVFSLGFFTNIGMSLTPQMNSDDSVSLSVTMRPGTLKKVILDEVFRLEKAIEDTLPREAYKSITARAGSTGRLEIVLPDISSQLYSASQIKDMIRGLLGTNPNASWSFGSGRGVGSGSAIRVEIHSNSTENAKEAADRISNIIATYVPEAQNISSDISNGAPKIEMVIDQEIAESLGVSTSSVLSTVQNALTGIDATTLNTFSNTTTYKLYVEFEDGSFENAQDLGSLLISTKNGPVRLDEFVTFKNGTSAKSIQRENKLRINRVTASAKEGVASSVVQAKVNKALNDYLILPEGVSISQAGDMQQFAEYGPTLFMIVALALVLVYAVMAAQFESLSDPFIIFATIPTMAIGVIFIHIIMGQDFSLFSIVGIVALIGVVVNNGIVLVDGINYEVGKKMKIYDACIMVAKERLRPISMTTLTTILGMVPMAFFPGEGSEMMQPIALTFVGGMVTGSLMTLFLSPVLYSVFNKRKERNFNNPMSLANQLADYDSRVK